MGAGSSSLSFSCLPNNEILKRFVSTEVISYNDPFWNTFLSFASRVPRNSGDSRLLDESIYSLFHSLATNAIETGNVATLLAVFLTRAIEVCEDGADANSVFVWQSHNALFILRVIIKLVLENYSEEKTIEILQSINHDNALPSVLSNDSEGSLTLRLLSQTVQILTDLPVNATTHALHLEAITMISVLLSSQMFSSAKNETLEDGCSRPRYLMFGLLQHSCGAAQCSKLVSAMLQLIIKRPPPPPDPDAGGSFVAGLAAGLWSVLTLGMGSSTADSEAFAIGHHSSTDSSGPPKPLRTVSASPLADQAELLLLVLSTHTTVDCTVPTEPQLASEDGCNYFRSTLFGVKNGSTAGDSPSNDADVLVQFSELYAALTTSLHTEHTTLLLYLLLHNNSNFRTYLLSVSEAESVVLPLLFTLHHAARLTSHHVYMALIIVLMLSEDTAFNASLHDIPISSVPWPCERPLSNISLGDLLILVLIRTITFNMTKMRDHYLHSNCLAALANMSSQFRRVHHYVCQRIVSLLETLSRRHTRLLAAVRRHTLSNGTVSSDVIDTPSNGDAVVVPMEEDELLSDLSVVEEVLRMVLEILNSTLTHQLTHNPQLLYTLLYKRHVFQPFSLQPNFSDVCMNIDVVLNFLMSRLEKTTSNPSVADVQAVIEEGVLQLPKDRLRKFPELKFKYVEESSPEEFFIPYVWTLVYQSSGLYWAESSVALFDPSTQAT